MALVPMESDDMNTSESVELKTGVTKVSFRSKKTGHIVWIVGILQKSLSADGWNQLCVIPAGYRPIVTVNALSVNSTDDTAIETRIDTDGTISVWPKGVSGTKNISISTCYYDF